MALERRYVHESDPLLPQQEVVPVSHIAAKRQIDLPQEHHLPLLTRSRRGARTTALLPAGVRPAGQPLVRWYIFRASTDVRRATESTQPALGIKGPLLPSPPALRFAGDLGLGSNGSAVPRCRATGPGSG